MKVIIINGCATSGKSTFVEYCRKHCVWCGEASTVDFVKEIATKCGWNGQKDSGARAFLSSLKDAMTAYNDLPARKMEAAVRVFQNDMEYYGAPSESGVFFIHCREPQEIDKLVRRLGASTLFIEREVAKKLLPSNHADADVSKYEYDYRIENNGSLDDLDRAAEDFLHKIGIKGVK